MKRQNIIALLVSVTIVVLIWIGFNTYHAFVSSKISPSLTSEIIPITPNFDTNVIQALKQREQVVPVYKLSGSDTSSSTTPSPAPTDTLTPTPTVHSPSATVSAQTSL